MLTPLLHLTPPTTPSSLSDLTVSLRRGDAKNRRSHDAEQTSRRSTSYFLSKKEGGVLHEGGGGSGGEAGCVPQCSDVRGLKETRRRRRGALAPWLKRSRSLRSKEGRHRSSTAEGGGVVFQPRRGVVSPPQPPPFLTALIFHFSWSLSSSKLFSPPVSSWWWFG